MSERQNIARNVRSVDCTVEPVTAAEAILWTKIDTAAATADETIIAELITAARMAAEDYTGRAFVNSTWEMVLDNQPDCIEFPRGPLVSVSTVKTIAEGGTKMTESATVYETMTGDHGKTWLRSGQSWTTMERPEAVMEITYTAGYGATAASVPSGIKTGIKMILAAWYEKREGVGGEGDSVTLAMLPLPNEAKRLLDPYRIIRI